MLSLSLRYSNVSTTIDPFWDISLDLAPLEANQSTPTTLEDCLEQFTRQKHLGENSWRAVHFFFNHGLFAFGCYRAPRARLAAAAGRGSQRVRAGSWCLGPEQNTALELTDCVCPADGRITGGGTGGRRRMQQQTG